MRPDRARRRPAPVPGGGGAAVMGFARTWAVALVGLDGAMVEVEADIGQTLPAFSIVGLPDAALNEARERLRAAARNSGMPLSPRKLTVNLTPATLPKRGSLFDLSKHGY